MPGKDWGQQKQQSSEMICGEALCKFIVTDRVICAGEWGKSIKGKEYWI